MTAIYWPNFSTFTYPVPFDTLNNGDPLERVDIWYGKTRIAGQSGESRMMIDLVVWAQYINVTDTEPRRHSKCRANALRREANKWVFFVFFIQ